MLVDGFGRVHRSLRISVTDRCNIRCFYCMPNENVNFLPKSEILTFEEISRIVDIALQLGIEKIRLTGGEPLVRQGLPDLVRMLSCRTGLKDLALTTNGFLLPGLSQELYDAGLRRLNVSLDTLREETFQRIARRNGLSLTLQGIATARQVGFQNIRINAVAIKDVNEEDVIPLAHFCREHDLHLRFIEFMPLDAENQWEQELVLSGASLRQRLEQEFGSLRPVADTDPSQPARDYWYADKRQKVGFIDSVTEPFCGACDRLRLTAEGALKNCLFGHDDWSIRQLLRNGSSDVEIAELFRQCVASKKPGHGIDEPSFLRPKRAMYQIGG
ncbi:MAG: GTP 3',8-cyclase MoaA [Pirellulaceae bacterium]|nr:GTP 3',8-cyclase MoaA [Pirellulaceae bacterium]